VNLRAVDELNGDISNIGIGAGNTSSAPVIVMSIADKAEIYFAVDKAEGQSITFSGADGSKVSPVESAGSETATAQTALYRVDLSGFDSQFEGKTNFSLIVSEADKADKPYTVTLDATPDWTGTAIFVVTRAVQTETDVKGGTLTRITTANKDSMTTDGTENYYNEAPFVYAGSGTAPVSEIPFSAVDGLNNALVWVNHNAMADTEYLIRVEKNEFLVRHNLSCMLRDNVIVRLRGAGGEKTLKYDYDIAGNLNSETDAVVMNKRNTMAIITTSITSLLIQWTENSILTAKKPEGGNLCRQKNIELL
jgi:hypothetical protein